MEKRLLIDLATLPEEGVSLSGELDPSFFELDEESSEPAGPVRYDLYATRFGSELLLQGQVAAPIEFECVRTLERFVQTIDLSEFAISIEVGDESSVDATEALREEVLIAFPAYPKCDDADEPMDSEIDSRYLAVDKPDDDDVDPSPPPETKDVWGALDGFQNSDTDEDKP